MNASLRANLFIRLLYGTIHLRDELAFAVRFIPPLASDCRVVLVRTMAIEGSNAGNFNVGILFMEAYKRLHDILSPKYVVAHLDPSKSAVLVPDTELCMQEVDDAIRHVENDMESKGILLNAGASGSFSGGAEVQRAFFQAQIALDRAKGNAICVYYTESDQPAGQDIDLGEFQKLYELILAGEAGQAKDMISTLYDSLLVNGSCSRDDVRQAFYLVRFIIESVIRDARYDSHEFEIPQYREHESAQILFNELGAAAEDISEEFAKRKSSTSQEFVSRVLAYIQDNIQNTMLWADRKLQISKNTVLTRPFVCIIISLDSLL